MNIDAMIFFGLVLGGFLLGGLVGFAISRHRPPTASRSILLGSAFGSGAMVILFLFFILVLFFAGDGTDPGNRTS